MLKTDTIEIAYWKGVIVGYCHNHVEIIACHRQVEDICNVLMDNAFDHQTSRRIAYMKVAARLVTPDSGRTL